MGWKGEEGEEVMVWGRFSSSFLIFMADEGVGLSWIWGLMNSRLGRT